MPMPVPTSDPPSEHQPPLRIAVALDPQRASTAAQRASTGRPYASAPRGETVFIVVDVIRATTSLCVLFERGARAVLVAPGVAAARALRSRLGQDVLLAGEIGGARPEGFDYGNSPAELVHAPVEGRSVLFATTNGTRAIRACAGGRAILAGALRNAEAVAVAALDALPAGSVTSSASSTDVDDDDDERFDIVIVCSGRGDQPAYDDTLCAGYILRRLMDAAAACGRPVALESGAQIALAALAGVEASGGIRTALAQSAAYRAIARIGLAGDLDWCVATDVTAVVPRVVEYLPGHDLFVMRAAGDASQR